MATVTPADWRNEWSAIDDATYLNSASRAPIRVSPHLFNTTEDIDRLVRIVSA
jgi:selenocysteine lyase/cysteine desulfurase